MEYKLDALNYDYLLFEYYKDLALSNDEFLVLLMIKHLLDSGVKSVTNEILEVKLDMDPKIIDNSFNSLITKGYVSIEFNEDLETSLKPLEERLYDIFIKRITFKDDLEKDKDGALINLISLFESYFKRKLDKVEKDQVERWIESGIEIEIIKNSLLDAFQKDTLSIKKIDQIIVSKIKSSQYE